MQTWSEIDPLPLVALIGSHLVVWGSSALLHHPGRLFAIEPSSPSSLWWVLERLDGSTTYSFGPCTLDRLSGALLLSAPLLPGLCMPLCSQ
eukprot:10814166-Heterocapsa_arctica.AAC.1